MLKKKISLFAPNLSGGGAERIISILAENFYKQGFTVDLLLGKAEGPYLKNIPPPVKVIDFDCSRLLFALPKLAAYLRKQKPDVLFTSQMHSSTIALWAIKISGVDTKVILRQPTMLWPAYEKKSLGSSFRKKVLLWTAKKWAYKVVATSQVMAEEFISKSKISPEKVVVIYNPLPVPEIRQKSDKPLTHSWLQVGQPPLILAVGRLAHVKDFNTLIEAFALVRNEVDARLVILGEGPLRAELEQLISRLGLGEYVQMPGFADNPYQYMKRSKVFVMSSLWEGFPNSMIEAMACGTHIISTNCDGGAAEILEDGKWGQLVPVQNPKYMAKSIVYVLKSDGKPDARERVECFFVDEIIKNYVSLLQD